MFRAGTYISVLLCLLQERACYEDTLATELKSIVECFIKVVDMPYQFSDEEIENVYHFQFVTHGLCQKEYWRIFECNYPIMDQLREVNILYGASRKVEVDYYKTEILEYYENATELQRQTTQALEHLILNILQVKAIAAIRNETRILVDDCSRIFLDPDVLKNQYDDCVQEYEDLKVRLQILQVRTNTLWYYLPPFVVIVLIFGGLGNGLLLLIFARHPETRTGPNTLLVNLGISDTLFLLVNIILDYSKQIWGFPFDTSACYVYNFVLTLITGSSVYSMTMLSFSRYVAVSAKPGDTHRFLTSTPVILASVWLLSALVAIPDTLTSTIHQELYKVNCSADNLMLNSIPDFFLISFLPLTMITGFYITTSRRLRESAQNMPGEAIGQDKVKMARVRGAKILPALAFVFAITYIPFYTFWIIKAVFKLDADKSVVLHILYYIFYFLFNLNSTLNPIALYLASGMFRKYFNKYLLYLTLVFRRKQNSPDKSSKLTTNSTEMTLKHVTNNSICPSRTAESS